MSPTRREFLGITGLLGFGIGSLRLDSFRLLLPAAQHTFDVIRSTDFLHLRFSLHDFTDRGDDRWQANDGAILAVHFPPQAIVEESLEIGKEEILRKGTLQGRLAGWSRLCFDVPVGRVIDITRLGPLLDWHDLTLHVKSTASPTVAPADEETDLEMPYRIHLSPAKKDLANVRWAHSIDPVTLHGWTELWHTRLATKLRSVGPQWVEDPSSAELPKLFSIYNVDEADGAPNGGTFASYPFPQRDGTQLAISPTDRWAIAKCTQDNPIDVSRLALSALGGWFDYSFQRPADKECPQNIVSWTHHATMGRDQYVQIVKEGYLYPLGHKAVVVKTTHRVFEAIDPDHPDSLTAYLQTCFFIKITEPSLLYEDRDTPFQEVCFRQLQSAPLQEPPLSLDPPTSQPDSKHNSHFIPKELDGKSHEFVLSGRDRRNVWHNWTAPLIFVYGDPEKAKYTQTVVLKRVQNDYEKERLARMALKGAKIAYAEPEAVDDLKTSIETTWVSFSGVVKDAEKRLKAVMQESQVTLQQVREMIGQESASIISFNKKYLESKVAYAANGVFADLREEVKVDWVHQAKSLAEEGKALASDFNKVAGLINPKININAISSRLGAIDLSKLSGGLLEQGKVKLRQLMSEFKLFGSIPLADYLPDLDFNLNDPSLPGLQAETIKDAQGFPSEGVVKYDWSYQWTPEKAKGLLQPLDKEQKVNCKLHVEIRKSLRDTNSPQISCEFTLENFALHLLDSPEFIIVSFSQLTLISQNGTAPSVRTNGFKVEFAEALKFIQNLADSLGLGEGMNLEIGGAGIRASTHFVLPSIAVGAYSFNNLSIYTGLILPFNGEPLEVRVGFCSRQRPFLMTAGVWGGGGYIVFGLQASGLKYIEAAMEFGGAFAIDLFGVVKGMAYVLGGNRYTLNNGSTTLTGYLRIGGSVTMWGLVTVGVELYIGLNYDPGTNVLAGEAELSLSIKIGFFRKSFSCTVRKQFAGAQKQSSTVAISSPGSLLASADPAALAWATADQQRLTFKETMPFDDWKLYLNSFAPE